MKSDAQVTQVQKMIESYSSQIVKSTGLEWVKKEVDEALLALFKAGFSLGVSAGSVKTKERCGHEE